VVLVFSALVGFVCKGYYHFFAIRLYEFCILYFYRNFDIIYILFLEALSMYVYLF